MQILTDSFYRYSVHTRRSKHCADFIFFSVRASIVRCDGDGRGSVKQCHPYTLNKKGNLQPIPLDLKCAETNGRKSLFSYCIRVDRRSAGRVPIQSYTKQASMAWRILGFRSIKDEYYNKWVYMYLLRSCHVTNFKCLAIVIQQLRDMEILFA